MAALGAALFAGGRRGRSGSVMRIVGAALIGLAIRPWIVKGVRTAGARRRHFSAHRSIEISRPIGEVFAFFKDFESFPRFIGSLRSVIDYQDGRSHWEIYTPSGGVVAWDVVVTKYVPNSVIAWESVPNSTVEMQGIIRFACIAPSRTRIDMSIVYRPVRTGLNDAVHAMVSRPQVEPLNTALEHARFYLESMPAPRLEESSSSEPTSTRTTLE
ncbi:MAG: hypothetical protein JWM41_831 [Gemmatimonadetes bacterium]|nr:hypothetical protein [Gemmatimonadota bacterium]